MTEACHSPGCLLAASHSCQDGCVFPLQLCCSRDKHPLPARATTLQDQAPGRLAAWPSLLPPTFPPVGCELTPGASPSGNIQGRDAMPAARVAASSRASAGAGTRATRGCRELGTSQGEPCLGDGFVSWGGGHLRSRNTREEEKEEEEADIPGESTSVRKQSGVQGCNTSQMRLGKVL